MFTGSPVFAGDDNNEIRCWKPDSNCPVPATVALRFIVMRDGLHCCSLLREAAVLDFASELAVRPNPLFFTMAALDFAGKFRVSGPKYNARSDQCRGMPLWAHAV